MQDRFCLKAIQKLSSWKEMPKEEVSQLLVDIRNANYSGHELHDMKMALEIFHKEIRIETREELIDRYWFMPTILLRKDIDSWLADQDLGLRNTALKDYRKGLQYPFLIQNYNSQDRTDLKGLYRSFIFNYERIEGKEKQIAEFLIYFMRSLKELVPPKDEASDKQYQHTINYIRSQLCKNSSQWIKSLVITKPREAKHLAQRMAEGDQSLWGDQDADKYSKLGLRIHFEEEDEIDEGKAMGEECRKCEQKTAVCLRMMQTRAADEPMTRFMFCKVCRATWTD